MTTQSTPTLRDASGAPSRRPATAAARAAAGYAAGEAAAAGAVLSHSLLRRPDLHGWTATAAHRNRPSALLSQLSLEQAIALGQELAQLAPPPPCPIKRRPFFAPPPPVPPWRPTPRPAARPSW